MRNFAGLVGTAISALLLASLPASASMVTDNVTFSASFTNPSDYGGGIPPTYSGGATPVSTVSGSFTITFDPTQDYSDDTADITNFVLNGITLDSPAAFSYYGPSSSPPFGFGKDELVVGALADGACCILLTNPLPDDFYLHIVDFTTAPAFQQLGYSQTAANAYFYTLNTEAGATTVSPVVTSTVPEPTSWALMIAGFAGLGLMTRRRPALRRQFVDKLR